MQLLGGGGKGGGGSGDKGFRVHARGRPCPQASFQAVQCTHGAAYQLILDYLLCRENSHCMQTIKYFQ